MLCLLKREEVPLDQTFHDITALNLENLCQENVEIKAGIETHKKAAHFNIQNKS